MFASAFGQIKGFFLCWLGIMIGHPPACLLTILLGRYCFKKYIQENVISKLRVFNAIDKAIQTEGYKIQILLRVQPVIPWNILNYMTAVTSCSIKNYMIGTYIGIIPSTVLWLYIGVNMQTITEVIYGKRQIDTVQIIFMVFFTIALFVCIYILSKESKRQL